MAKVSSLATIAVLCVLASAVSALKWGRCNVDSLIEDFSLEDFQGVWYEVAYTDNVPVAEGARCQFGEYRVADEYSVYFKLGFVYDDGDSTNVTSITEGYLSVDRRDPTIWSIRESRFQRAIRYWIVDTDYHTFAIAHSCVNRFVFWREEFTWVISRTRMLTGDALLHVQQRFILSGLDGTSIVPTNQERCTHHESEGGRDDEGTRDDDADERDSA